MIIPHHCREVSVKKVSFSLTKQNITQHTQGKKCYHSTRYLVLRCNSKTAVIEIEKTNTDSLFEKITNIKILSTPNHCIFLEDNTIDVLNPSALMQIAEKYQQDTVVVKGKYEHVSFIHGRGSLRLRVFDIIPPTPAKLHNMVEQALQLQNNSTPIEIIPEITDLQSLAATATTDNLIFPCNASHINQIPGKKVHFLDELNQPPPNSTLIGCNTSLKIFKELYHHTPEMFIQFCPGEKTSTDLFITKCCELKEGFKHVNGGVIVPWGAEFKDVTQALNSLLNNHTIKETNQQHPEEG